MESLDPARKFKLTLFTSKQRVDLCTELIKTNNTGNIICPSVNEINGKKKEINIPVRNIRCDPTCVFDIEVLINILFGNKNTNDSIRKCSNCGKDVNIDDYYIDIYYEYVLKNLRAQYKNMGNNNVIISADGSYQIQVGDSVYQDDHLLNSMGKELNFKLGNMMRNSGNLASETEAGETFKSVRKVLEDVYAKKIEEFNEEKKKMSHNEVVHIEINPQMKKDIERCLNKAILIDNRTFSLPFTFAKSLSDDRKVQSSINQLYLYFPTLRHHSSIFVHLDNGSPYYIDEYSCMVTVPPRSIWITGGLHHLNRSNLSNEAYEIDLAKIDLQNNVRMSRRPSFPTKRAFHGSIYVAGWLYICGGTDTIVEKHEDLVLNSCNKINVRRPTEWIQIADMSKLRSFLTLASHKDKFIYAFGGLNILNKGNFENVTEIDKYSIEQNKWSLVNYKGKSFEPGQKMAAFTIENKNRIIIFGGVRIKQYNVGLTNEYEYDCIQEEFVSSLQKRVPHSEVFMDKNETIVGDKVYILAARKRNLAIIYDIHKKAWDIAGESINITKSVQ